MNKTISKVLLFGGIALFAAACNAKAPVSPAVPITPPSSMDMTSQTYTNSSYNFSFTYGDDFSFVTPTYGNLANQVVQVQLGNSAYPKTNFSDADFTVSQDFAKTQAACLQLSSTAVSKDPFTTTDVINGVTFYTAKGGDAAAGNDYASNIYRTFRGTDCIELTETIHTGNIDNYPTGTVTAIDTTPIQAKLDQILNSFKFTN